jgi:DNA-binding NarL/FixJ family response regulator
VAAAVQNAPRLQPDVVLMDIRLPDGSGVDACREIRAACPGTRVIFLTSFTDEDTVLGAVFGGADGYLLKEAGTGGLLQAIHSVARGHSILDPSVTQQVLARMRSLAANTPAQPSAELSAQQQKVLELVAEGRTNKEIAVALNLSDKTVKNYVRHVFQKLRVTRRSQAAAHFARRSVPSAHDS